MKLLNEINCTVEVLEDIPCLYWHIFGEISNHEFVEYVKLGAEWLDANNKKNNPISIIIDLQDHIPTDDIDLEWVNNEVMPQIYFNEGLKNIALIPPMENEAAQCNTIDFYTKTEEIHNVKILAGVAEAKEWLKNCEIKNKKEKSYSIF